MSNGRAESYYREQSLEWIKGQLTPAVPLPSLDEWAMAPDALECIITMILRDRPLTVVEFGSGASTVYIATALRKNGVGRIVSIDHDEGYGSATLQMLAARGLEEYATVRIAPLVPVIVANRPFAWYDPLLLSLPKSIDMVIVDGPPGYSEPGARYPALPFVAQSLAPGAVVLLDDLNRPDEDWAFGQWISECPDYRSWRFNFERGLGALRVPPLMEH